MSISIRIQELRKQQNLSQGALAKALGISRQAVSKWENGASVPDMQNLILLAEILDTEVEYLASGTKPEPAIVVPPAPVPPAPIVVNLVEKRDKIIERIVEKPVVRKVIRYKYLRNPIEFGLVALAGFVLGFLIGKLF